MNAMTELTPVTGLAADWLAPDWLTQDWLTQDWLTQDWLTQDWLTQDWLTQDRLAKDRLAPNWQTRDRSHFDQLDLDHPGFDGSRASASGLGWPANLFTNVETDTPADRPAPRRAAWARVWAGADGLEGIAALPDSDCLHDCAHIFFGARPGDAASMAAAEARAETVLRILARRPGRFAELARALSECPSAVAGGTLGMVAATDVTPEFVRVLAMLEPGQTCPVAVRTPYGVHVVHLHDRSGVVAVPRGDAATHCAQSTGGAA